LKNNKFDFTLVSKLMKIDLTVLFLNDLRCTDAADPGVCPEEDKERAKSEQNCGFLLSDSSPFKACKDSKTVDFDKMYSSCEFDVCSSDADDVHCQTLESTALACSQHGFQVKWRNSSFCRTYLVKR
jgi:hypothetical protein